MNLPIEVKLSVSDIKEIILSAGERIEIVDPTKYGVYYTGEELPPQELGVDGDVYLRWIS